MYIDTHFHLDKDDDIEDLLKKSKEVGVERFILCGCNKEEIINAIEIANRYENIYLSIGFHPEYADSINDSDIEWLKDIISNNKKVVAIGEIGIDFHYTKENKDEQIGLFEKQLRLAEELNLPVVIHTRDAINLTYEILKKYKLRGSMHCFSGSLEMANKFIDLGYKLGIGGVLTFKNSNLKEVVKKVGINNIIFETDSPYLAPTPHRGEKNYSYYIPLIAKDLADYTGISINLIKNQVKNNTFLLFDIN